MASTRDRLNDVLPDHARSTRHGNPHGNLLATRVSELEHTTIADIAHEVMAQAPQPDIARSGVWLTGVPAASDPARSVAGPSGLL
jgi:hypothetical protein